MTRILIISDQPLLLCGFKHILVASGFGALTAPTAAALDNIAGVPSPDLTLLDITAGLNLEDLSELYRHTPQRPVVLWTDVMPLDLVFRALEFGLRGIVPRHSTPEQLVEVLARVVAGEVRIGFRATQKRPARRRATLTPREGEVVTWLRQGMRNKEIAAQMNITEGTVKIHLFRLFQKLGVRNRFELASCTVPEDAAVSLATYTSVLVAGAPANARFD